LTVPFIMPNPPFIALKGYDTAIKKPQSLVVFAALSTAKT